ncbi:hypothetical protein Glove_216g182 [Diversispora epigaea]|uniref:Transmembrane protein n=1 Tax=Diversispora epigaea TaxID=1348612 RepID=A0A397IRB9_9GLOM|nr:hypothetical protein Glove_216g182 [Diversispora epigaea]
MIQNNNINNNYLKQSQRQRCQRFNSRDQTRTSTQVIDIISNEEPTRQVKRKRNQNRKLSQPLQQQLKAPNALRIILMTTLFSFIHIIRFNKRRKNYQYLTTSILENIVRIEDWDPLPTKFTNENYDPNFPISGTLGGSTLGIGALINFQNSMTPKYVQEGQSRNSSFSPSNNICTPQWSIEELEASRSSLFPMIQDPDDPSSSRGIKFELCLFIVGNQIFETARKQGKILSFRMI